MCEWFRTEAFIAHAMKASDHIRSHAVIRLRNAKAITNNMTTATIPHLR
jgi:hypothetical protein